MPRNGAQDTAYRADAKNIVVRDSEAVMPGFLGLEDDVAALLVDHAVSPIAAQSLNDLPPAQIPWQLHAQARISSRTR